MNTKEFFMFRGNAAFTRLRRPRQAKLWVGPSALGEGQLEAG